MLANCEAGKKIPYPHLSISHNRVSYRLNSRVLFLNFNDAFKQSNLEEIVRVNGEMPVKYKTIARLNGILSPC